MSAKTDERPNAREALLVAEIANSVLQSAGGLEHTDRPPQPLT